MRTLKTLILVLMAISAMDVIAQPTWVVSTAPMPFYTVMDGNYSGDTTWASGQGTPYYAWSRDSISHAVTVSYASGAIDMYIGASGSVTVADSASLAVSGTLTNLPGTSGMTIRSSANGTGSLIESSGISGTVDRYYTGNQWHLISAPVSGAVSGMYLSLYLMNHDEATNAYTDIVPVNIPLNVMQGYALWNQNGNDTASYSGPLGQGNISNTGLTRSATGANNGWNLVGNPYPSSIDWDAASGWTKTNIGGTIYYYSGSTWATYSNGAGGTNGGSNYITPGQGFFVSVNDDGSTTGTLGMTDDVRVNHDATFFKATNANSLKLSVSNGEYTDETVIVFAENATTGFDSEFDAYKLLGFDLEVPQVYSVAEGFKAAANVLPEVMPVTLDVKAFDGELLSINISGENSFPDVYLEDLATGLVTDLNEGPYSFIYDESFENRFIVHFSPLSVAGNPIADRINIYSTKGKANISVPDGTRGSIHVYNLMGQEIKSASIHDGINSISLEKSAFYIVKTATDKSIKTTKLYIK